MPYTFTITKGGDAYVVSTGSNYLSIGMSSNMVSCQLQQCTMKFNLVRSQMDETDYDIVLAPDGRVTGSATYIVLDQDSTTVCHEAANVTGTRSAL